MFLLEIRFFICDLHIFVIKYKYYHLIHRDAYCIRFMTTL